jgi:hypothetical protein
MINELKLIETENQIGFTVLAIFNAMIALSDN